MITGRIGRLQLREKKIKELESTIHDLNLEVSGWQMQVLDQVESRAFIERVAKSQSKFAKEARELLENG